MISKTKHVLVSVSSDGYIEVYASHDVVATVINRPVARSPKEGRKVDELLENILPRPYKEIFWPGHLVCSGQQETLKPTDIRNAVDGVRVINGIGDERTRYSTVSQVAYAAIGGGGGRRANVCPTTKHKGD